MPRWLSFEERFWSSVKKTDNCWDWIGDVDGSGYGRITKDDFRARAHRVAYEMFIGPIPSGLMVCHHCDNKRCVNPEHLFVGTGKDNMQDWTKKGKNRLVNDRSLWRTGDAHWTRQLEAKATLKAYSIRMSSELASGKRQIIRGEKGRIMGTRRVADA